MARSILTAIRRIKSAVGHWLTPTAIEDVCSAVGHVWRNRVLDPVTTVHLFVLQVVHGNTACAHVPHLGGVRCSGAAYGQARARLPLAVLERLLRGIVERLRGPTLDEGRWRGHRTFLADGSGVSMPDTPALQEQFGQPGAQKAGCGFPIMHVLALFHAATGLLLRVAAAPLRTHDLSQIGQLRGRRRWPRSGG